MSETIIETRGLKKYFKTRGGMLHAVDGVDLSIRSGRTLGVVGESGCGKSTLGRTILRLTEPTEGEVLYRGEDILGRKSRDMRRLRQEMTMIFQDPYASLNPRMAVEELIADPIRVNKLCRSRDEERRRVRELMDTVGIASRFAYSYPHELDGGRRQRIGIAKALAVNPKFIVCDEPVSALDVSIQAQILNLLMDLQDELGLTYMFITHNLSVVRHISDDIMVMYMGVCVERAPADMIFDNPTHPYTQALLRALPLPRLESIGRDIEAIMGEVSSPIDPKPGCRFAPRCPRSSEECGSETPMRETAPGHFTTCVHAE